ncbi:NUDIX hydrolase [Rhodobacteraceae bacterium]|nr:NUDIX hydrolase [Paracoccaceae bacterium]
MTISDVKQRKLELTEDGKRGVRTQFGALCWRKRADDVQVLLVTSRRRKRWIIPKGWPQHKATPAEAALTEAWEEAGVEGRVKPVCLGIYSYNKELDEGAELPCVVAVFPIRVKKLRKTFPEKDDRRRKWFSLKKAAKKVDDPELGMLLANFDPSQI